MALGSLPYKTLRPMLRAYRKHMRTVEDQETRDAMRRVRLARKRGYLTKSDLEAVCHWKSPRAMRLIRRNGALRIRKATEAAFSTRSERSKIEQLTSLFGVSVPMASAILMLADPKRYGVIDIRVWQLLHRIGAVTKNPSGRSLSFRNWYQFLMILRHFAKEFRVKPRDIELTLFRIHRDHQEGNLYGNTG